MKTPVSQVYLKKNTIKNNDWGKRIKILPTLSTHYWYCFRINDKVEQTGIILAMYARSSKAWWCVCGLEETRIHSTTSSTCMLFSGRSTGQPPGGVSLTQQWSRLVNSTCFVYSTGDCSSNCRHLYNQLEL